jgi:uncharacterized protein YndB with AHSA1/START domain
MSLDGKVYTVAGTYREIRPPEKLVFTWRWENEPVLARLKAYAETGRREPYFP